MNALPFRGGLRRVRKSRTPEKKRWLVPFHTPLYRCFTTRSKVRQGACGQGQQLCRKSRPTMLYRCKLAGFCTSGGGSPNKPGYRNAFIL